MMNNTHQQRVSIAEPAQHFDSIGRRRKKNILLVSRRLTTAFIIYRVIRVCCAFGHKNRAIFSRPTECFDKQFSAVHRKIRTCTVCVCALCQRISWFFLVTRSDYTDGSLSRRRNADKSETRIGNANVSLLFSTQSS